jgi:hypothetical protein
MARPASAGRSSGGHEMHLPNKEIDNKAMAQAFLELGRNAKLSDIVRRSVEIKEEMVNAANQGNNETQNR